MRVFHTSICLIIALFLIGGSAIPAAANMGVGEATAGLSDSALWELNRDSAGTLYISDYRLPAIVVVNPTNGAYTRHTFSLSAAFVVSPSDAKPDASGNIWWSDYFSAFGRLNPNTSQVTTWDLAALSLAPAGLAFDSSGRVWLTQRQNTRLLRFNPSNNELCRFDVGGGGDYIIAYGGWLWVGDSQARRILRFDPATNQLRWWALGGSAFPKGLAFDGDGLLWWADAQVPGRLGRLNPNTNQAVTYALPGGAQPVAVTPGVEVVWYTDLSGTVGFVDPARASSSSLSITTGSSTPSPTCSTVASGAQTATKSTGTFLFNTVNWPLLTGAPTGVTVYTPPNSPTFAVPYGIAFSDGRIWSTDQDRLVLARTPRVPRPPTVTITRSGGNLSLSWPPVTQDEGGGSVTVSSYQVWSSPQPYFRPWDSGVTFVGAPASSPFTAGAVPPAGQSAYFVMRSVADSGLISRISNRVGAFSFSLTPGTNR